MASKPKTEWKAWGVFKDSNLRYLSLDRVEADWISSRSFVNARARRVVIRLAKRKAKKP